MGRKRNEGATQEVNMGTIRETLEIQDRFSPSFRDFSSLGERVASTLERIDNRLAEYTVRQDAAGRAVSAHAQQAKSAANDLQGLISVVRRVTAALGGVAAVKGILNLSDELTQTQARLAAINDGLQTNVELNNMIFAAAQRARGSYLDISANVAALKAQTGDVFGSTAEAVRFTELLNKQFAISGTSTSGIASTMYNLTQALATGVLRGNDLQMVLSNSPAIVQRIAKYMDVPVGKIKELATEGKITADIVKNAIMGAGEEIDAQFKDMPMTFGQAMQKVRNVAIMAFQPIGQIIADAINSEDFDAVVQSISTGLLVAARLGARGFEALGRMVKFARDNMQTIAPILGIIVGAIVAYNAIMGIATALTVAHGVAASVAAVGEAMYAAATAAAAGGQSAFNAALAACPITWVVAAIVAAIAVVVALIMWFHELANTGHTIFGDIAGVAMGAFSVIQNALAIVANAFIAAAEFIVNAWNAGVFAIQNAIYTFALNAANAFNSVIDAADAAATAIANAFVAGANMAIGGINKLIGALNAIPGVNIGTVSELGEVGSVISQRIDVSGFKAPTKPSKVSFDRFETTSMGDAFSTGFEKGASFGDAAQGKITGAIDGLKGGLGDLMGGGDIGDLINSNEALADAAGGGKGGKQNVGTVDKVKNVKLSDEDMKIYRDLAERRYMANVELQTLAPNISVSIPESAAKNLTSEDVANKLKAILIEQAASHTAVAHAH